MGDDSFPSILPPFLSDTTKYAINQWGANVRPKVYDFPVQVHPATPLTVAVDMNARFQKEPAEHEHEHEHEQEPEPEDARSMPLAETSAARAMKLLDPIIPGQLMSKLFKGDPAPQKKAEPLKEAIFTGEENSETAVANSLTCETFEFNKKTYMATFFGRFIEIFSMDKSDGSLKQIISTEMNSTIRSISVSKDAFTWAPPASTAGNIYILCLTSTEVYLFQFCKGENLVFLSSVGFKCGVHSAIVAFVDHPSITTFIMTRNGLTQWDFSNGVNSLNILTLDSPTFRGIIDPWLFISFSSMPYQIFIASRHTLARVNLDTDKPHITDYCSFKSEEVVSIRRSPDRPRMLLVVTTANVHVYDSRTLSRPIASFIGKNYRKSIGIHLLDKIDVSGFLEKLPKSGDVEGVASVFGILNSNLRVPMVKLQMMLCEKTSLGSSKGGYGESSSEDEEVSSKRSQRKRLNRNKSFDLPFEKAVSIYSLSRQKGVKIPYNTLDIRLRRYEPFTRVDGVCSCAASPSEFYLYLHTDTKIYVQKWRVMDSKEEEELCLKTEGDPSETYKRVESGEQEAEFVPIPSARLANVIGRMEEKHELKVKSIGSLEEWFKSTLAVPLTLEELCHKLEAKLGMERDSIDANELRDAIGKADELKFISFLSLDKLCHSCNSKSECTCFYDGDEDLPPWKTICYAGKMLTDSMKLDKELDDHAKKVVELCEVFVASRPDLYRSSRKTSISEAQKVLTEDEVMDHVKKTLQTQEQNSQRMASQEINTQEQKPDEAKTEDPESQEVSTQPQGRNARPQKSGIPAFKRRGEPQKPGIPVIKRRRVT